MKIQMLTRDPFGESRQGMAGEEGSKGEPREGGEDGGAWDSILRGSRPAVQQGPGILGPSSGEGDPVEALLREAGLSGR